MARGRPRKLTIDIQVQMIQELEKHPMLRAPAMRNYLLRMYRENLRKQGMSDIDFKIRTDFYDKKILPGVSTVQKMLANIRKKQKELPDDPQKKPWSMATLDDYPISPEAIPAVLEVWKSRIEQKQGFTIREAKWAARLSAIPRLKDIKALSSRASQYARLELIYQLIDRPFNSTIIDALLLYLPITPDVADLADLANPFEVLLPVLVGVREDAVDQIRDLKQGKIKGIYLGQHKQLPDPSLLAEIEIPGEKDIFKKSKGGTS